MLQQPMVGSAGMGALLSALPACAHAVISATCLSAAVPEAGPAADAAAAADGSAGPAAAEAALQ